MSTGDSYTSRAGRRSLKKRWQAYLLTIVVLVLVQMKAFHFWSCNVVLLRESTMFTSHSKFDQPLQSSSSDLDLPPLPLLPRNETFGACLMVKGDNDLLSEWIPYHYTILPLRYLLVVTDVGNPEDPKSVLKKWTTAQTDLHWWVFNVSEFENIHGEFDTEGRFRKSFRQHGEAQSNGTINLKIIQDAAHYQLIHRQKAMITYCAKFMKERGVRWTSMYDTDEFLAINWIGAAEQSKGKNKTDEAKTLATYGVRPLLPTMESNATVVDIINSFDRAQQPLKACHTIPRVSFGALENFTCPGSKDIKKFSRATFDSHHLGTLRYQQHAVKVDFSKNRFGKVFVDISNISDQTLSMPPRNIHRPFPGDCIRPIVPVQQAPFYLMHYAGGWDRFKSKDDKRRGFEQWKKLADVSDSTSCCQQEVYRWLPRFVDQVGLSRAKFLLGV